MSQPSAGEYMRPIDLCKNCKHSRNVHASFASHPTHCTMIIDTHNTPCNCKEFIENKE